MNLIDEQHTKGIVPYGQLKLVPYLTQKLGYPINVKRVRRLMRIMGLEGLHSKKMTTKPSKEHKIYPYLLRNKQITRINEVWSIDITYIKMEKGFMYMTAIIDWFSRYIIDWELSNTMDNDFCIDVLNRCLKKNTPEIFNSDQGSQFTANNFLSILENSNIKISMDGRGRCLDNIMIERFWRSLKCENIYIMLYETVPQLQSGIKRYVDFYNNERLHQALNYKTPAELYLV